MLVDGMLGEAGEERSRVSSGPREIHNLELQSRYYERGAGFVLRLLARGRQEGSPAGLADDVHSGLVLERER